MFWLPLDPLRGQKIQQQLHPGGSDSAVTLAGSQPDWAANTSCPCACCMFPVCWTPWQICYPEGIYSMASGDSVLKGWGLLLSLLFLLGIYAQFKGALRATFSAFRVCWLKDTFTHNCSITGINESDRWVACFIYVHKRFRKINKLFVTWTFSHRGKPMSWWCLSYWVVEAIVITYCMSARDCSLLCTCMHIPRNGQIMGPFFKGYFCGGNLCSCWAFPHTHLAESVLSVGS